VNHALEQRPLVCLGIDVHRTPDRCVPGKWPIIENVIALYDTTISPRPGLGTSALATAPANKTPWHSIRTLNDANGVWARIHGIADRLAVELSTAPGTIVDKLGGLSGNPLTMVQAHPTQSPQPQMYVADSNLMRKVDSAGNLKSVGLVDPVTAPKVLPLPTVFNYKAIDLFKYANTAALDAAWTAVGTIGQPALISVVNTVISAHPYVQLIPGSVNTVIPASMSQIVEGAVLTVDDDVPGVEDDLVFETYPGSTPIVITRILYDSGSTGPCSISLRVSVSQIQLYGAILITGTVSGGSEMVYCAGVIEGSDGTISIRTSTSSTRVAGDTLTAQPSYLSRIFEGNPFNTIKMQAASSNISATTPATPATLTLPIAIDLSNFSTALGSTAITFDDYLSILLRCNHPELLDQISLMMDCDAAGSGAGTVFTENYYRKDITPSDITGALANLQLMLANRQDQIQRNEIGAIAPISPPTGETAIGDTLSERIAGRIDSRQAARDQRDPNNPNPDPNATDPTRTQMAPGQTQFFAVRWRLSDMIRVGTDSTRGLKDINSVRLAITCHGTIVLDFGSIIVRGGAEPEVSDASFPGYEYRYYAYDSSTGVRSNTSPVGFGPVRPVRWPVQVSLTQHPDAACDKLAVERRGGSPPGWHLLGTTANSATPVFIDTISDAAAESIPQSEDSGLTNCALWPLPQKPQSGSGAVAAGTSVQDATAPWSTLMMRGTGVIVGGKFSLLRRVLHQSGDPAGKASIIELEDNVGGSNVLAWEIPKPVYVAQPLPVLFGVWEGRMFGLGDPVDPSAYYVTRRRDYDSTFELLRFEITGQILQNGCIYNGAPYIWSTEHLFRIENGGFDDQGNLILLAVRVPGTRGLFARWACTSGDRMYWLDREGLVASSGGESMSVTDDDLYPLFPHDGTALSGIVANALNPPDLAQAAALRLSFGGQRLYFLYIDTASARRALEYRIRRDAASGWYPHVFTPGVATLYYEEGPAKHAWLAGGADATTAKLYALTDAQSDGGTAIAWKAVPKYEIGGDGRKQKRWGDYATEIDLDGSTVNVTPQFDLGASAAALIALNDAGVGALWRTGDLGVTPAGSGVLAHTMSLLFAGSVTTKRPKIKTWEPSLLDRPETTLLRATDFEDAAPSGPKYVRGVALTFDSLGSTRSANVYIDGDLSTVIATISGITSGSGPKRQFFPLVPPFYASTLLISPTDAASWMLFGVDWMADAAPDSSTNEQPYSDLGYAGAKWLQGVVLDGDTAGATVSVNIEGDEAVVLGTFALTHNGRAEKVYTFNSPVLTHLVRAHPLTAMRLWPTPPTRYVWEPEPESALHYETQQTTHDIEEPFKILRDGQITVRSTSAVTFSVYDGELGTGSTPLFTKVLASTAGLRKSYYVSLSAIKAKSFIYVLDSPTAGFALYRRDTWIRVRGWGRVVRGLSGMIPPLWATHTPFGADSRRDGALV
jgi:hypothetical protein